MSLTRREFISNSLVSLASGVSLASPIRSNIGVRNIFNITKEEEPPLPEGVVAVEWLKSDGNQYVIIGDIFGADYFSIMVESEVIPSSGCRKAFGISYQANFQDDFGVNSLGWAGNAFFPCVIGEWCQLENDKTRNYDSFINGDYLGHNQRFFDSISNHKVFVLFCGSSGSRPYKTSSGNYMPWIGRIGRVRISGGGEMIRDLIPVRVGEGEEAEGFFYDLVSGEFFGNGGTGKLGIGGDL